MKDTEFDRIRGEYRKRDESGSTPYRWDNPGYVTYMHSAERALLRAIGDSGLPLAGARVLDVGCGGGYFLHRLREYGAGECHGIDLMENRIEAGKERYPALELRVGSATALPYRDGEFDLVTQFTCLSSILDDEVRLSAASEMRRVAAGGWVLSFDMRGPWRPGLRNTGATPTHALERDELERLFGKPVLLRRVALNFELAELTGRHPLVAAALSTLAPLRSHLVGIWSY